MNEKFDQEAHIVARVTGLIDIPLQRYRASKKETSIGKKTTGQSPKAFKGRSIVKEETAKAKSQKLSAKAAKRLELEAAQSKRKRVDAMQGKFRSLEYQFAENKRGAPALPATFSLDEKKKAPVRLRLIHNPSKQPVSPGTTYPSRKVAVDVTSRNF